jgi:hypothetical protein
MEIPDYCNPTINARRPEECPAQGTPRRPEARSAGAESSRLAKKPRDCNTRGPDAWFFAAPLPGHRPGSGNGEEVGGVIPAHRPPVEPRGFTAIPRDPRGDSRPIFVPRPGIRGGPR